MGESSKENQVKNLESKFVDNVFRIFDNLPIGINFVDEEGKIVRINKFMVDYFHYTYDISGRHISDVEPSSRLPIVLKTRKAEMSQRHRFSDGREAIVHRIPVIEDGKLLGALGILWFGDMEQVRSLLKQNKILLNQIQDYEKTMNPYSAKYSLSDIIGVSDEIAICKEQVKRIARSSSNVLILGESGVGKELFAHAIHLESARKNKPFVRVNCAAIPESLLESELFGYDDGAFTGARRGGQAGKFELANGGTIFLDEIGDMPNIMQAKLLRVLQEGELERLGGKKMIKIDVRVISATNLDLDERIKKGDFRSDLFYRLNVLSLKIPPLRERPKDISSLVYHFLHLFYQQNGLYCTFSPECIVQLSRYSWPGNIRELRNVVEKIALEAEGRVAGIEDIPNFIQYHLKMGAAKKKCSEGLVCLLEEVEEEEIKKALKLFQNNKMKAAEYLKIPKVRLYRKLKKFKINV